MCGIKVKALLCRKGLLCNVMVHFLIVEQQDREKVNKAAFQSLHLLVPFFKFQMKIFSFVKYLVQLIKKKKTFTESKNSI